MKEVVTLALIGDVMLGRGVNQEIHRHTPESFWGDVLPLLRGADVAIANLECAITQHTEKYNRMFKMFHFRADPAAVKVLSAANIGYVSLANNHVLDYQEAGLMDTLQWLDEAGIRHAGAGRNLREATAPVQFEVEGIKVGILALTDNQPDFAADRDRAGTNYLRIRNNDEATIAWLREQVTQLRDAGMTLVILSAHWGPNMVVLPSPWFRNFAHAAIDCGVDIFHGHSAHLFQGVERYEKGLILYDTGDFLDDYAIDSSLRNDWSFVFLVELDDRGLQRLRMLPVRLHYARVDLARGDEFVAIRKRMQWLCAEFNTNAIETPEGLEIVLR